MRELARAQGFPDYFKFYGTVDQVNRQVGRLCPQMTSPLMHFHRSEMQS